jgi:regulator of Ty1 transposition protein 103
MAYNDDAVLARLSALNDSHDSIATAAQWIMFHRRHADRTVQLWMQRLKDSSASRRLSLVYLANEVAQQSRIRHKEDFIIAFSPVVAEATAIAYKGAPADLQGKIRRVVEVWKDRAIFEPPIQGAIDARLDELDKSRGASKPGFSGSPFGSSNVPSEFAPLISSHQSVTKLNIPLKATISSADQEYEKQTDTSVPSPSAPVYAARLNGLLKTLANAESAVADCVKAREGLVLGLEKLLESNRAALEHDREASSRISKRKVEIEEKKQQVETGIMQALGSSDNHGSPVEGQSLSPAPEPDRPEMEALTPPAMESLTPPSMEADPMEPLMGADAQEESSSAQKPEASGIEMLSDLASSYQSLPVTSNGSNKRRRVDEGEFPDLGGENDGIDADVAAMLEDGSKA